MVKVSTNLIEEGGHSTADGHHASRPAAPGSILHVQIFFPILAFLDVAKIY